MKTEFNDEQIRNETIFLKIRAKSYETVKQFEDDIKWFARHCRSIDPQLKQEPHGVTEQLVECVEEQIETINACAACYQNLFDAYTKDCVEEQCTNRHVLLWAKAQNQHCYWPAKVLGVNAEEKTVRIQYFGDHSCCSSPVEDDNSYVFSWTIPYKMNNARTKAYSVAKRVSYSDFVTAEQIDAFWVHQKLKCIQVCSNL